MENTVISNNEVINNSHLEFKATSCAGLGHFGAPSSGRRREFPIIEARAGGRLRRNVPNARSAETQATVSGCALGAVLKPTVCVKLVPLNPLWSVTLVLTPTRLLMKPIHSGI